MKEGKELQDHFQGKFNKITMEHINELAPGGVMVVCYEENFPIIYANPRMANYLGYESVEEYMNLMPGGMFQVIWEEDREFVRQEMKRQLTGGDQYTIQYRVVNRDGRPIWVHNVGRYVESSPSLLVSVYYDIDESKQHVRQQETHLEQLRAVMDHLPGGICVFYWKENRFEPIILSKEFCRMLGVDEAKERSSLSADILCHIHPEDRQWVEKYSQTYVEENETISMTARFKNEKTQEYIWIKIKGNFVLQEDGAKLCYVSCTDVTKEKELEVKLKASEYSLSVALENCNIYSGKYDLREKISIFNRRIQEDFGLPERLDTTSRRSSHVMYEEGREELTQLFHEMCTGKREIMTVELPMKKVTGEWVWTRQTYTVVEKDDMGNPLMIISTALDITKQKQDEQRFNVESAYHQMILQNMYSVIRMSVTNWKIMDYAGEYSMFDNTGEDLFEVILNAIPDAGMRETFHRTFQQKNMLYQFESGENKITYTFRIQRLNRSTIWVEATAEMLQRGDGEVLAIILIKDVNHQMIADQIRNTLIDSITDFVGYYIIEDGTSSIISEKPEFCFESDQEDGALQKLFGYIYEQISTEERDAARENMRMEMVKQHLKYMQNYQYIYHAQKESDEHRIKRVDFCYLDQSREIIVVSQRDITDIIKEEEMQKAELQRALNLANRASRARDEFLSNMSHDLRTPLNGIIGASELAKDRIHTNPEQVEEYLEDINSSGRFMLNLVNDILDMSRLEMGKQELERTKISWKEFAKDLQQVFESTCEEKDLKLTINLGVDIPSVIGDAVRLKRVLQNLLSNATKFTEHGGHVECLVSETKMIGEKFLVTIVVQDNGVGISEEFQNQMYEIFSQEKNGINDQNIGSGLGLAISKSLVELMGGTIQCESKQGVGTRFILSLPFVLEEKDAKYQKEEKGKVEMDVLRGHKVLLVEDHPLNSKIVQRLLESKEIFVEHVVNGKDAVERFEGSDLFSFDAILMDISMPVMDGIEATKRIRALERSDAHMVPIIALTANAFEKDKIGRAHV